MGDFKYFLAVAIIGNILYYLYSRNKRKKSIEKYSDPNELIQLKSALLSALNKSVNGKKFTEVVHGFFEEHSTNVVTYSVFYNNYLLAFNADTKDMAMYSFKKDYSEGLTYEFALNNLVNIEIESLKKGGKLLKFMLTGEDYKINIYPQTTIQWYEAAAKTSSEGAVFVQEAEMKNLFSFLESRTSH